LAGEGGTIYDESSISKGLVIEVSDHVKIVRLLLRMGFYATRSKEKRLS